MYQFDSIQLKLMRSSGNRSSVITEGAELSARFVVEFSSQLAHFSFKLYVGRVSVHKQHYGRGGGERRFIVRLYQQNAYAYRRSRTSMCHCQCQRAESPRSCTYTTVTWLQCDVTERPSPKTSIARAMFPEHWPQLTGDNHIFLPSEDLFSRRHTRIPSGKVSTIFL